MAYIKTLLAAQTAASTDTEFEINEDTQIPFGVSASGLDGVEELSIEFKDADGGWVAISETLSVTNPRRELFGYGIWRVNKGVTLAAVLLSTHQGNGRNY
ncbi:MAG: hypothetical protein GQ569_09245 [Methylococcaceae bacterium]|nr:hypothetical protein [Methylococcaceae bacterium]